VPKLSSNSPLQIRLQAKIFPLLVPQLKKCIPRELPMHAESILPTIDAENMKEFLNILEKKKPEMIASKLAR
jgi:hypothetical protein